MQLEIESMRAAEKEQRVKGAQVGLLPSDCLRCEEDILDFLI